MVFSNETASWLKEMCEKHDYCEKCPLWSTRSKRCIARTDDLIPCYFVTFESVDNGKE